MSTSRTTDGQRLISALGTYNPVVIDIDAVTLSEAIWKYMKDVAKLHSVHAEDLTIFLGTDGSRPKTVHECLKNGCKFFDSLYYIAASDKDAVDHKAYDSIAGRLILSIAEVQRALLLFYLYIMFRGSYPIATGKTLQTDVPTFMVNMLGFRDAPGDLSNTLASFDIHKVPIDWVKYINVADFSSEIQQRIALGTPGYRMMMPFVYYDCKPSASNEVKEAAAWVRRLALKPADWAIFPGTRSARLTAQLKSFNKALGNLILESFTDAQIDEMIASAVKILYKRPVRDPRADSWRTWVALGDLPLSNPILTI